MEKTTIDLYYVDHRCALVCQFMCALVIRSCANLLSIFCVCVRVVKPSVAAAEKRHGMCCPKLSLNKSSSVGSLVYILISFNMHIFSVQTFQKFLFELLLVNIHELDYPFNMYLYQLVGFFLKLIS